jgi:hypothetical protein
MITADASEAACNATAPIMPDPAEKIQKGRLKRLASRPLYERRPRQREVDAAFAAEFRVDQGTARVALMFCV